MKKVSLIVLERERDEVLEKLREAGVIHLKKKNVSAEIPLDLLVRQIRNRQALRILAKYTEKKGPSDSPVLNEDDLTDQVLTLNDEKELFREQLLPLAEDKRRLEEWGDFDSGDFALLNAHGVRLFLYRLPLQIYKRAGGDTKFIIISRDKHWIKAIAVGDEIPGMDPVRLPEQRLSDILIQMESIRERLAHIESRLAGLACHKKILEAEDLLIHEEIEFETARAGMETLEGVPPELAIAWLSGFVPGEKIEVLKTMAEENCWTLVWNDPAPEDLPPTLLKNSKAVRIIQPLFSMLGTLPGYREYDISCSYLVFLCLFFALILGDAVYGIILLVIGAAIGIIIKKKSGEFPDVAKLLILLSACTIIWGTVNGSWFAIPESKLPPVLQMLVIQPFNNRGSVAQFPLFLQKIFNLPAEVPSGSLKTQWNIQFLCFTIGMIQLVWARGKNIKNLLPSLTALAQLGWLFVVMGMYFLVLFILLRIELPPFVTWLIGAGIAFNFIFSEQKAPIRGAGNFLKNIAKSFANIFPILLKAIGCFGDIISYIRLFAVGMAGSIIVQTVNSMAIPPEGLGNFGLVFIFRLVAALLILVFAHSLHLAINALSVIVHGLRLNLLEYAGNHLEMGWSGYEYKPFAFKQKK